MAKIKIICDAGETFGCVEEDIVKAILNRDDESALNSRYDDNLMNLLSDKVDLEFKDMYVNLVSEIIDILIDDNQ